METSKPETFVVQIEKEGEIQETVYKDERAAYDSIPKKWKHIITDYDASKNETTIVVVLR